MKYVNKEYAITHPIQEYLTNKTIRKYRLTTLSGQISSKEPFNCLCFEGNGIELHNHGINVYCDYSLINEFEDFIDAGSNGKLCDIIETFSRYHPIIKWIFKTLEDKTEIINKIEGFSISHFRDDTDSVSYIIYFKGISKFLLIADKYNYIVKLDKRGIQYYYSKLRPSTFVRKFLIKIKVLRNLLYRSEGEDIAEIITEMCNEIHK